MTWEEQSQVNDFLNCKYLQIAVLLGSVWGGSSKDNWTSTPYQELKGNFLGHELMLNISLKGWTSDLRPQHLLDRWGFVEGDTIAMAGKSSDLNPWAPRHSLGHDQVLMLTLAGRGLLDVGKLPLGFESIMGSRWDIWFWPVRLAIRTRREPPSSIKGSEAIGFHYLSTSQEQSTQEWEEIMISQIWKLQLNCKGISDFNIKL